ncbi:MAG: prolyl aminopeptidase [Hyphomicrobiaceae bacterium]
MPSAEQEIIQGRVGPGLFRSFDPYMHGMLDVGDGHSVYFEQSGNPAGIPVLVVHGGPGGGSSPLMRRYHDPARYRIILFDQRGCGRSIPRASLESNTTWHLVADIEALRQRLGIERWVLFGGSWGSTLALTYAISHPDRVLGLVLRGIFLLRQQEIDWFYRDGCNWLFPDAYEQFLAPIPHAERSDLIAAYYARLTNSDAAIQLEAARAWSLWEGTTLSLRQNPQRLIAFAADEYARTFARIECHYFINRGFFQCDTYLLDEISRIRHIPCIVVHGRYDVITPLRNAWDLKRAWREIDFRIVPEAGHAMSEPGILAELVAANAAMADRVVAS